jgi:hypothetical protein
MKNFVFLLVACGALSAVAQTSSDPATQVQTQPANVSNGQQGAGGLGGGLTFSNRLGQTFSADDLATKLQNLRSAVDQALPALTAFNENYSNNVVTGRRPTGGGTLSGLVSDVLHKNQSVGQNSPNAQGGTFSATNVLSVLHGLLNTNSVEASGSTPGNAQDLIALQSDLQPVLAMLQRLNVGPSINPLSTPNPNPNTTPAQPQYPNGGLTPTGR